MYIHFALGKALDDVGDYGRAFEHFRQGNALKRREVDYDEATSRQVFRNLTGTVGSSLFKVLEGAGDPSGLPIFVLGMPRSGSTLVEQILASHPQVHAAGELTNLSDVVAGGSGAGPVRSFLGEPRSVRRQWAAKAWRGLPVKPSAEAGRQNTRYRQAPGNFFHVGLIRLILPNAKIIHTMRDPMDTCVSCFLRLFDTGQSYSFDLGELGRYYAEYHGLMAHWRSVLPAGDARLSLRGDRRRPGGASTSAARVLRLAVG